MDELAMGQDFLTTLPFSLVSIITQMIHVRILLIFHQRYIILVF
jgi:hypothetical protein